MTVPGLTRTGVRRLESIDMLRGLVIVLMVLDHVRDFFHASAFAFDPTDPARTHAVLYATRWITHLCAPTFVFLAGVSVYLQRVNGKSIGTLSRFLLTRGSWLIVLELTVVAFGFNFALPFLFMQVIWAIGIGLILLAGLVWLPRGVALGTGVLLVAGHELLGTIAASDVGALAPLWRLALEPGRIDFAPGFVAYPALPWFGVMCLGYALGPIFTREEAGRRRAVLATGLGALALFALLRALDGYGDPSHWVRLDSPLATVLSFFNVSKYPPSLAYVLVTLGVALTLMPLLERLRGVIARALLVFGRTPLFTYLVHIYTVHGAALLVGVTLGIPAGHFFNFLGDPTRLVAAGWGFNLLTVYVIWLLVLVALYPVSRRFADLKIRRRDSWLSYL